MKGYLAIAFIFIVFLSCKTTKDSGQETQDIRVFTVETTACFGRCPIYKLTIASDGTAFLDAIKFTEADGKYSTQLSDSTVEEFYRRLDTLAWSSYEDVYRTGYTDLPSVIINYISPEGIQHKVILEQAAAPKELQQLSRSVEWFRVNLDWEALDH
ncbi:MAG: hypothetical protein JXR19_04840 [Bacteroidia bacterium]